MAKDRDHEPEDTIIEAATELSDEALEDVDAGLMTANIGPVSGAGVSPFNTVSGIDAETITAYQDGDDLLLRKRPGRIKFTDVKM